MYIIRVLESIIRNLTRTLLSLNQSTEEAIVFIMLFNEHRSGKYEKQTDSLINLSQSCLEDTLVPRAHLEDFW